MEYKKYKRGENPNSLASLVQGRINSIETRRKNRDIRLMMQEYKKAEKEKRVLNLELEIFKIKQRRAEDEYCNKLMDAEYYPISKKNLNIIIRNVFNK
jgi:hypothetical protein